MRELFLTHNLGQVPSSSVLLGQVDELLILPGLEPPDYVRIPQLPRELDLSADLLSKYWVVTTCEGPLR